jgi:hypothetical protein
MERLLPIFMLLMFGGLCLIIPLSIPFALLVPAAEMHVVETDDFAAGFRVREWWPVFRANLSGFVAAFGIYYVAAMGLGIAVQLVAATVVLACLMFILFPFIAIYIVLIMHVTVAQAYRDGKMKLAEKEILPQTT